MAYSRNNPPTAIQACPLQNPCKEKAETDDALLKASAEQIKHLTGNDVITEGKLPLDDQNGGPMMMSADATPCQQQAYRLDVTLPQV